VIVLRNTTERPEGVEAGTLRLAGVNENDIYENVKKLLVDENEYNSMKNAKNPYGDGKASERIVNILCEKYGNKS
jgi:UDP-N-acetylglucosamine 2-epimerase (non-hydrolysing)